MGKHKYSNDKITVGWDSEVCIHSAVCIKNLGKVFDTNKRPWVNVDAASVEEITQLIDTCPSGALSYQVTNQEITRKQEKNMDSEKVMVTISENGPYLVKGDFDIVDANGKAIETKQTVALCRCGSSSNKPFCDGTHKKVDFKD